jgi:imidazoleglycerol-phosphate dehydratase
MSAPETNKAKNDSPATVPPESREGFWANLEGGTEDCTPRRAPDSRYVYERARLRSENAAQGGGQRVTRSGFGDLPPAGSRAVYFRRETAETRIELCLNLDGKGEADLATGVGFFDHMLELLARHSLFDLTVRAQGDLHVDAHHTVEDVGICLGKALAQALDNKAGIRRYGSATLPMDETLVTAAVDLSGRPLCAWNVALPSEMLGAFNAPLAEEFWRAVASSGALTLHLLCHYGRNTHHVVEAVFKAAARALRQAVEIDPRGSGVPSTKGVL